MPAEIFVATKNRHKWNEISCIMKNVPFLFRSLEGVSVEYDEPYLSFFENALHKARAVCQVVSQPVLSDDSGLCVDSLRGAPGVRSARYTPEGDDSSNRHALLNNLDGISHRRAQFVCVIVFIRSVDDPMPLISSGVLSGSIATEERGLHGFGYDSIFQPDGYEQTLGEMEPALKQQISHRAQALRKMREELFQWLPH